MKGQNWELAALINRYEETKERNIALDIAIKISEMRGLGDPVLTQRALLIIDEEIKKTGSN